MSEKSNTVPSTEKFQDRNSSFTQSFSSSEFKANFERFAVDLRKSHRCEYTAKRRALLGGTKYSAIFSQPYKGNVNISEVPVCLIKLYPELANEEMQNIEKLQIIAQILENINATEILIESLTVLLEVLGYGDEMPLEPIFRMGFITLFLKYTDSKYSSQIVYPAVACLANLTVCNSYFTTILINHGIIEAMIKIISSNSLRISSLAIKALGNIMIDSKEYFIRIKQEGGLEKISYLMEENKEIRKELYEALCFFICQASIFHEHLAINEANKMICWIEKIIEIEDEGIRKDALTGIYNLTNVNFISFKSKVILTFLINNSNQIPAIKAISNIASRGKAEAEYFLKLKILSKIFVFVKNESAKLRCAAYKCINNLVTSGECENALDESQLIALSYGLEDSDNGVRREAVYLFSNISKSISFKVWQSLINEKLLKSIKFNLTSETDVRILNELLFICTYILLSGKLDSENTCATHIGASFEESGCLLALENLMNSKNQDVSDFAKDVLEEYFPSNGKTTEQLNQQVIIFNFS